MANNNKPILNYLCDHVRFVFILFVSFVGRYLPDEIYLRIIFRLSLGQKLNLKNPKTFNEKLQWLKLYNRNPLYTDLVDKIKVRDYVKEKIGEEYLVPLIGTWNDPDEIDFEALPERFVLKCNHNSGKGMYICKDKSKADYKKIRKNLRAGLKENYFFNQREWPYKNVERRIVGEEYLEDSKSGELSDYKLFCFDGTPKLLFVVTERQKSSRGEPKFDFFDIDGNHLDLRSTHPNAPTPPAIPQSLEKMKALAAVLSEGFPHVRVDFYEVDGKIYFGEMTFFHNSGFHAFDPPEWDIKLGSWLDLKNIPQFPEK